MPGDEIPSATSAYINGTAVATEQKPPPGFYDEESRRYFTEFRERLGDAEHAILVNPKSQPYYGPEDRLHSRSGKTADTVRRASRAKCRPGTIS